MAVKKKLKELEYFVEGVSGWLEEELYDRGWREVGEELGVKVPKVVGSDDAGDDPEYYGLVLSALEEAVAKRLLKGGS